MTPNGHHNPRRSSLIRALLALQPGVMMLMALGGWALLALIPVIWPPSTALWLALGGALLLFSLQEARELLRLTPPTAQRWIEPILPVGVWSEVRLRFENDAGQPLHITLFDHYPQPAEVRQQPATVTIAAGGWSELTYHLRPLSRGEQHFGAVQVLLHSRFRLWRRDLALGETSSVRVYPNFATITEYMRLAGDQRIADMGIHLRPRRGEGQTFYQLREYRYGDSLLRVDWKATSRMRKLISKEYQEEKDQSVLFLLDCGNRMRAQDGALSHFDHALNALILLSYVALRQGDAIGFVTFAGSDRRLPALKGRGVLSRVIGGLFDLQPTLEAPDYLAAANALIAHQRKRSLVILLTNLRDEDRDELVPALRLLRHRHLVVVASLREAILDETLEAPVDELESARLHAATAHYLASRESCHQQLLIHGSLLMDVRPQELPVALVNKYLDLKRSQQL